MHGCDEAELDLTPEQEAALAEAEDHAAAEEDETALLPSDPTAAEFHGGDASATRPPNFECSHLCSASSNCNDYCELNQAPATCREFGWCTEPSPNFCNDIGGRWIELSTAHSKRICYDNARLQQGNGDGNNYRFLAQCTPGGNVTFRQDKAWWQSGKNGFITAVSPSYSAALDINDTVRIPESIWTPIALVGGKWAFKQDNSYMSARGASEGYIVSRASAQAAWEAFSINVVP